MVIRKRLFVTSHVHCLSCSVTKFVILLFTVCSCLPKVLSKVWLFFSQHLFQTFNFKLGCDAIISAAYSANPRAFFGLFLILILRCLLFAPMFLSIRKPWASYCFIELNFYTHTILFKFQFIYNDFVIIFFQVII